MEKLLSFILFYCCCICFYRYLVGSKDSHPAWYYNFLPSRDINMKTYYFVLTTKTPILVFKIEALGLDHIDKRMVQQADMIFDGLPEMAKDRYGLQHAKSWSRFDIINFFDGGKHIVNEEIQNPAELVDWLKNTNNTTSLVP